MAKAIFSAVSVCPWGWGPCTWPQSPSPCTVRYRFNRFGHVWWVPVQRPPPCSLWNTDCQKAGGWNTTEMPSSCVQFYNALRVWGASSTGQELFHILQPNSMPTVSRQITRVDKVCVDASMNCENRKAKANLVESFESISTLLSETYNYTLLSLRYSLLSLHYALLSLRYTLLSLCYTLLSLCYTLLLLHYTLLSLCYALLSLRYTLLSLHYTLLSLCYALLSLHFTLKHSESKAY